ncbi:MAG: hypothetical protein PWR26_1397 [Methanosarcinales archaeon]|nr:hypothetical protein [Methanosarcinales archaeon]MDN5295781.1 hypothetical protein [Methanosarcinales archaeon]
MLPVKRLLWLLKNKGFRYTYNWLHFHIFWGWIRGHPNLIKLLYRLAPYPSYIEMEVTTRCGLRCIMCEHTYWNEPNRDMSFDEFKMIVDQFPNLKWIGLTGIGESFVNKDFMKMLRYVKERDVFVELYDNFYHIDESTARELIELEVDKIFVSFDAATKETYERIRVGSSFERVMGNVRRMFELKREMGAHFPEIAFHYIVCRENMHEMLKYIELVHSIAGSGVEVQFTRMLHEFEEVKHLFVDIPQELIDEAEKRARELGVRVVWNLDVPTCKPPMSQCIEWTMPFIFVTGHVIPCCSGNEAGRRDFQKETALGNVFEQPFKEIWNGEKYRNLRRLLSQGRPAPPCVDCCLYSPSGDSKCTSS